MTTAADIRRRLIERYPLADGWITMAEVTPPGTSRRFDLIAVMGWSSRGHEALGFEIKVARGDWLRELNDPAKAEPLASLCSRYWICAPPGIVQEAELPPAWGLLIFHPEQIRTGRQAPRLDCAPWDEAVWRCMLLRCATRERRTKDEIEAARMAGWKDGFEKGKEFNRDDVVAAGRDVEGMRQAIMQAERVSGESLGRWTDFDHIAEAFRIARILKTGRAGHLADRVRNLAECLTGAAEQMTAAAAAMDAAVLPPAEQDGCSAVASPAHGGADLPALPQEPVEADSLSGGRSIASPRPSTPMPSSASP